MHKLMNKYKGAQQKIFKQFLFPEQTGRNNYNIVFEINAILWLLKEWVEEPLPSAT